MILRIIVTLLIAGFISLPAKAEVENISQPIPGRYIVEFNDSNESALDLADKLSKKHGLQNLHVYSHAFKGVSINVPPGKEKDLTTDPTVKKIVQDFTLSAFKPTMDKRPPSMGGDTTPTQIIPTGINWIDAELNTTNEGSGTTIAVLDTGIDFSHQDLMVNASLSRDFTNDGTGGNDNNTPRGTKGHGTHVAGVIAALDNNIDVLGVGSLIDLVAVKVLDRTGSGAFSWIIAGLDYVIANADVIGVANLSLGAVGGTNPSQGFLDASTLLREAVQRTTNAGVVVVVASGNESVNVTTSNVVPGGYPEVISVSALDDRDGQPGNDKWASFSNYGTEVDIIAPGVLIESTALGGGTSSLSGTSFSSPHVAGTVGLYIAKNGRPTNGNAQLLGSLISAISQSRSPLPGEPADGYTEPSCHANGPALQ